MSKQRPGEDPLPLSSSHSLSSSLSSSVSSPLSIPSPLYSSSISSTPLLLSLSSSLSPSPTVSPNVFDATSMNQPSSLINHKARNTLDENGQRSQPANIDHDLLASEIIQIRNARSASNVQNINSKNEDENIIYQLSLSDTALISSISDNFIPLQLSNTTHTSAREQLTAYANHVRNTSDYESIREYLTKYIQQINSLSQNYGPER